jgi:hypothetical protein
MSLNKPVLENAILVALQNAKLATNKDVPPAPTVGEIALARGLATAIDSYIRSSTITVLPGIAVTTTGGAGSTTGIGNGNIS